MAKYINANELLNARFKTTDAEYRLGWNDALEAARENAKYADVVEKETVRQAFAEACQECRDACEEFDGFYADCNQCLLHGVKEKLKDVLEVAEQ